MNWDIYTDDLETNFTNPVIPVALGLLAVPTGSASIQGKDLHKAALQGLQKFVVNFVQRVAATGRLDQELTSLDGDQVITSSWTTEFLMNKVFQQENKNLLSGGVISEAIVTIQALSR